MTRRSTGLFLLAASLVVACSGAKGVVGLLGEIQEVQHAVAAASGTDSVHVNLANERFLSIGVINSPINGQPDDVRATRALELAQVAYASFPSRDKLQRVSVAFVKQTRRFLILTVSDGRDAYSFEPQDLKRQSDSSPGTAAAPEQPSPK